MKRYAKLERIEACIYKRLRQIMKKHETHKPIPTRFLNA